MAPTEAMLAAEVVRARRLARSWPGLPSHTDRDELEGAALEGLNDALSTWKPSLGPFGPWAERKMRYAILQSLRDQDHLSRRARQTVKDDLGDERAHGLLIDLRGPVSIEGHDTDEPVSRLDSLADPLAGKPFGLVEQRLFVLDHLGVLTDREMAIVALHFFGDYTETEISGAFHVSQTTIGKIERNALAKMLAHSQETPKVARPVTRATHRSVWETGISAREDEVLHGISEGLSNAEIAVSLFIGEETVKTHVRHLLERLQAKNRAHLVTIGYQTGLLVVTEEP